MIGHRAEAQGLRTGAASSRLLAMARVCFEGHRPGLPTPPPAQALFLFLEAPIRAAPGTAAHPPPTREAQILGSHPTSPAGHRCSHQQLQASPHHPVTLHCDVRQVPCLSSQGLK